MLPYLFLSIFLPHVAMPAAILAGLQQAALQEEANVLAYGVLQLREALHHLYNSTAQKLDRIRHITEHYEQGLRALRHQTQSAQQHQKEIREITEGLKAEDMALSQQSQSRQEGLQKVHVGYHNLAQQVKVVEEMLSRIEERSFQSKERGFHALKAHMQHQNLTIWSLLGATQQQQQQQQQQQMAQWTEQLLWLQEQMKNHRDAKPNVGDVDKDTAAKFMPRKERAS